VGARASSEASGLPAGPGSEIHKASQCFWPSIRLVDTLGKLHKDEALYLNSDVHMRLPGRNRQSVQSPYMTDGDTLVELGPYHPCSPGSSLQLYLRSLYNLFSSFVLIPRSCHHKSFGWKFSQFTLDISSQHGVRQVYSDSGRVCHFLYSFMGFCGITSLCQVRQSCVLEQSTTDLPYRARLLKQVGWDDGAMLATLILFSGYLICQLGSLAHGNGRRRETMTDATAQIGLMVSSTLLSGSFLHLTLI
jgi:hypothetical protein